MVGVLATIPKNIKKVTIDRLEHKEKSKESEKTYYSKFSEDHQLQPCEKLHIYIYIYIYTPNPCSGAGCDTTAIFKCSLTGWNSDISFSETSCHIKVKEFSLPNYLLISWRENSKVHIFPSLLARWEMQTASSRIWTRIAVSTSFDYYITTSSYTHAHAHTHIHTQIHRHTHTYIYIYIMLN